MDLNLLLMDGMFIKKEAEKFNEARLMALTSNDKGQLVAEIRFFAHEYASGSFKNPLSKALIPTKMEIVYKGIGHFNIHKGQWDKLVYSSQFINSGMLTGNSSENTQFVPIERIPIKYLEME